MLVRALAFFAFLAVALPARAELPPGTYDTLRVQAEEALIVQVTAVKRGKPDALGDERVFVTAKVLCAERSKAQLKVGDTLTIAYTFHNPNKPRVGPRPVPLLVRDAVYPAFLSKAGEKAFKPAAQGASFQMTPSR